MSEKKGRERPAGGPESQRAVEAEEGPGSDAGLTLSKGERLPFPEGVAVKPWRKKTPEQLHGFSLSSWKEAMASMASPQRGDPGAGGRGQVAREGGPAASDTPTARCLQPSYWSPAVAAAHGHKPGGLKQQKFLPSYSGDRKSNIQQGHTPQGTWGGDIPVPGSFQRVLAGAGRTPDSASAVSPLMLLCVRVCVLWGHCPWVWGPVGMVHVELLSSRALLRRRRRFSQMRSQSRLLGSRTWTYPWGAASQPTPCRQWSGVFQRGGHSGTGQRSQRNSTGWTVAPRHGSGRRSAKYPVVC